MLYNIYINRDLTIRFVNIYVYNDNIRYDKDNI